MLRGCSRCRHTPALWAPHSAVLAQGESPGFPQTLRLRFTVLFKGQVFVCFVLYLRNVQNNILNCLSDFKKDTFSLEFSGPLKTENIINKLLKIHIIIVTCVLTQYCLKRLMGENRND